LVCEPMGHAYGFLSLPTHSPFSIVNGTRSPWPFVVSGPLKHPKLRLKRGPHRQKRSDGASTMPEHRKLCIPDILQLR
ncbi:MAG: hypothetical protein AAF408_10390, partial [Pseudomonadota bacterium]